MSKLIVEVVKIDEVMEHPNADKLSLARVKGWTCVTGKDQFKTDDKAIYIPIDSILPESLENSIFGNTKVKLSNHRIKTIRIRGVVSQGLLISLKQAKLSESLSIGKDVKESLNITKYEPSKKPQMMGSGNKKSTKRNPNPNFNKYTSLENVKNFTNVFNEDDIVSVTEKVHGTNFRAGYVKKDKFTFWEKVKRFFGVSVSENEFVYGSHNVQLQLMGGWRGFYKSNVYAEAVHRYKLEEKLKGLDAVIYGEVYGAGIQKNYTYGCELDERKLVVFDVKIKNEWLGREDLESFCESYDLPCSLEVYRGAYDIDLIKSICTGNSKMHPEQKIIEGGVIKPIREETSYLGRKVVKLINDNYLLQKDLTEYH